MPSVTHLLQRTATIITILLAAQPIANCGFTDSIEPHNLDHVLTSLRTPRTGDNSTLSSVKRQAFIPASYANHLSALANMANFGGFGGPSMGSLRTVMMGGMLYGLSLIPAVVLALGGNAGGGILSSLGLNKRALPETSSAKMPLLSEPQTRRLLQMLHSAFRQWNVADEECKQLFVCQMYRQVSSNGVSPDLELFKEALLHILERGGQRRAGRAAESLLAQYDHYFAAARMGMKQDECESNYTSCDLSLYPRNDGFKKPTTKNKATKEAPRKKDKDAEEESEENEEA